MRTEIIDMVCLFDSGVNMPIGPPKFALKERTKAVRIIEPIYQEAHLSVDHKSHCDQRDMKNAT